MNISQGCAATMAPTHLKGGVILNNHFITNTPLNEKN